MSSDVPVLKTLFWEATLRCNAGCSFCGSRCEPSAVPEVDHGTVLRAFESVAKAFDPHEIMVNVTGGEPLLRKDLFEVMAEVRRMGFPWGMVTNASLIDDAVIHSMKECGMRTISVSVDDLFEAHDRVRRLPGAFSRIVEAIRKLGDETFLDTMQITTVVTKRNIDHLDSMLGFIRELPVDSWRVALVDPIGRCLDEPDLLLGEEGLREYFSFLDRNKFSAKPLIVTSCSHFLGDRDTLYRSGPFRCEAGRSVASILVDGSIFVCPNVPRSSDRIQGNIRHHDLAEVWRHGFAWYRDDESRKVGACARCPQWSCCKGDSLHTWDFDKGQPNFCIMRLGYHPSEPLEPMGPRRDGFEPAGLKVVRISYGSSSVRVVRIGPGASSQLYHYFHWGQTHPANVCEQMVAAFGWFDDGQAWVEELVPVPLEDRDKKTARLRDNTHEYVNEELGVMNRSMSACGGYGSPFQLLGYLHSHPGNLNATMSLPDLEFGAWVNKREGRDCLFGIVNPQKKDLCVYWDSAFSPVQVDLCVEADDSARWL